MYVYQQIKPCPSKNDLKHDYMVENIVKILTASMSNSVCQNSSFFSCPVANKHSLSCNSVGISISSLSALSVIRTVYHVTLLVTISK